jgi:hypothetical protein
MDCSSRRGLPEVGCPEPVRAVNMIPAMAATKQHLHLGVYAAELVVGPTHERVVDGRIEAKQDLPERSHA